MSIKLHCTGDHSDCMDINHNRSGDQLQFRFYTDDDVFKGSVYLDKHRVEQLAQLIIDYLDEADHDD